MPTPTDDPLRFLPTPTTSREGATIGLVTRDEHLVERIAIPLRRSGARLVVGDTPRTIEQLLRPGDPSVCVLDARERAGKLMLQVRTGRAGSGPARVRYTYSGSEIGSLVHEMQRLLPGGEVPDDPLARIRGGSAAIELVREQLRSVARFRDVAVMLLGETGTGKELVARALHEETFGTGAPFVAINCAAIPEHLLESELFGHEAGAYTGARGVKTGLFEAARGGTIFLDEIGEMPARLQAKLLRVLESGEFRRVGSNRTLELDARVVSATNREPWGAQRSLRPDVVYRLAGFTIHLPPLREREGDVDLLSACFLEAFRARYGALDLRITSTAMELLRAHDWPGNVRELRAIVEHAAIVAREGVIGPMDVRAALSEHGRGTEPAPRPAVAASEDVVVPGGLRALERRLIARALAENGGNVSRTARQLGIPRSTLRSKLDKFADEAPPPERAGDTSSAPPTP